MCFKRKPTLNKPIRIRKKVSIQALRQRLCIVSGKHVIKSVAYSLNKIIDVCIENPQMKLAYILELSFEVEQYAGRL